MSSQVLAHEEVLPAYAEGQPAYGDALPVADVAEEIPELFDRGKDWPLAFVIFAPVLVAYGAIGYGIYRAFGAVI